MVDLKGQVETPFDATIERARAWAEQPLPLAAWLAVLVAFGAAARWRVYSIHITIVDQTQQLQLTSALASADLRDAFVTHGSLQASPPGYGLFALPFRLLLAPSQGIVSSYLIAGWAALIVLGVSVVVLGRVLGIVARSPHELFILGVVVTSPIILACYTESYHPGDLLALACVLFATAAVVKRQMGWAVAWLAAALLCKQWGVIFLGVLVVAEPPRERIRLALGTFAAAGLVMIPFFATNPTATWKSVAAAAVVTSERTVLGHLGMTEGSPLLDVEARILPLLIVAFLCLWLFDTNRALGRDHPLSTDVVIAALVTAAFVRPLLDPAGYLYYYVPAWTLFALRDARWRWPLGTLVGGWVMMEMITGKVDLVGRLTDYHGAVAVVIGQSFALAAFLAVSVSVVGAVRAEKREAAEPTPAASA